MFSRVDNIINLMYILCNMAYNNWFGKRVCSAHSCELTGLYVFFVEISINRIAEKERRIRGVVN